MIPLLRRRDTDQVDTPYQGLNEDRDGDADASSVPSQVRSLEVLDRWITETPLDEVAGAQARSWLAAPQDRVGKGAMRMFAAEARQQGAEAARALAGKTARSATATVARFFATGGERQALLALSSVPQRTLAKLGQALSAKVEAHILEHVHEVPEKAIHSMFQKGTSVEQITDLMRATLRAGARPILSTADNGALVFVFENDLKKAIGTQGEHTFRMVADLEGRVVTAFPVAAEKKLATLTVRGITVAAKLAPLVFLSALAESEAEAASADATARLATADQSNWLEDTLALLGPYGMLDSSPIASEPNLEAIKTRTEQALAEAQTDLGRALSTEERDAIRGCIYSAWTAAARHAGA
jgi:hypothetical protein